MMKIKAGILKEQEEAEGWKTVESASEFTDELARKLGSPDVKQFVKGVCYELLRRCEKADEWEREGQYVKFSGTDGHGTWEEELYFKGTDATLYCTVEADIEYEVDPETYETPESYSQITSEIVRFEDAFLLWEDSENKISYEIQLQGLFNDYVNPKKKQTQLSENRKAPSLVSMLISKK